MTSRMSTFISLIRGINVAGHKPIKMAELRALYVAAGLRDPRTLLQSGNVVFESPSTDSAALEQRIERAIATSCGIDVAVIVRTPAELRQVVAGMPFSPTVAPEHGKLGVMFLKGLADAEGTKTLLSTYAGPEHVRVDGTHVYVYYTDGMGRSKLSNVILERKLKQAGTTRNFRTVTTLLALAESSEPSMQRGGNRTASRRSKP
jgi:uncharacterized protein (DUF1697 family)